MAPVQPHQGGAGSFDAGGDQDIRQAGAVAGSKLPAPDPGALRRLAIQRQHVKGRHEGIQTLPFLAIAHAGVQRRDRAHEWSQGLVAPLQECHGLGLIPPTVDEHGGVDHQQLWRRSSGQAPPQPESAPVRCAGVTSRGDRCAPPRVCGPGENDMAMKSPVQAAIGWTAKWAVERVDWGWIGPQTSWCRYQIWLLRNLHPTQFTPSP